MKGFVQGYNTQIAVDPQEQIVVAVGVTQCAAGNRQLIPMTRAAQANTGKKCGRVLADRSE